MKQKQKLNHVYFMYISLPSKDEMTQISHVPYKTAGGEKCIPPTL